MTKRLLQLVLDAGAAPAGPGEFTRRAFLNGKMDLAQAEAVMGLISASGEQARKAALAGSTGVLSRKIESIKQGLLEQAAHLAAWADFPEEDVPQVDAVLLTHSDNDHFSRDTCRDLAPVCGAYHAPRYVAGLCQDMGLPGVGHGIGESFTVGPVKVTLTPADHAWQNEVPGAADRVFLPEDFCGFWLDTPDGSLWAVGDSRLLEEHLHMPTPDLMLFDFSDSQWHIGLDNAVKLANAYPHTPLLLWHWGCVDAPDMTPFNGDPADLIARIQNPERALVLAPGEPLELRPLNQETR
jgi:L-ascorbate metabolism protein UlaG (beta-lactamase superfamily)